MGDRLLERAEGNRVAPNLLTGGSIKDGIPSDMFGHQIFIQPCIAFQGPVKP